MNMNMVMNGKRDGGEVKVEDEGDGEDEGGGEDEDDDEDAYEGASGHLTVIAMESIVGAPAQEHEDEAEHAEGEEEATGVDVHRDDGDARDRARD